MPCRDYSDNGVPERMAIDHRRELDIQKNAHQLQSDYYAKMLCAALTVIELKGLNTPEICVEWWKTHKKLDKERRKRERAEAIESKARKDALAKLSKKEQRLLGLLDE